MTVKSGDEVEARRYLLGDLADAEQTLTEERFFHDAEFSDLLTELESDLVDEYVREELSPRERDLFERHFLTTARRREKVRIALALRQMEAAEQPAPARLSRWQSFRQSLGRPFRAGAPAFAYAPYAMAAAALLMVLGGAWLLTEIRRLRSEVAQLRAAETRRELKEGEWQQQLARERREGEELTARLRQGEEELARSAAEREKLEREMARLRQQQSTRPNDEGGSSFFAAILSPGFRSDNGPERLTLPPGARTLRLQLALNRGDDYPAYRVELQNSKGVTVWSRPRLSARARGARNMITVDLPSGVLTHEGEYELALRGISPTGQVEDLAYYYFAILKK